MLLFGYLEHVFMTLNLVGKVHLRTVVTTSFHMIRGRVRHFSGHFQRLTEGIPYAATFEDEIREQLRAAGPDVFGAISVENHSYNVELRPSRDFPTTLTVDAHGHRDERAKPEVKGSDLAWQARAAAISKRRGADTGLLIDERGYVISPIEGSLLVLQGEMVFHSTHERALPSVLEAPILEYLGTQGCTPKSRPEGFNIEELRNAEVWLIDSLTGIQLVSAWVEYGSTFPVSEKRPVATYVPTYSEVNKTLWDQAETV